MGQSEETYNVRADLTTEDRILGDHDDKFRQTMRRFFVKNVCVSYWEQIQSTAAVAIASGLGGRAGGQHRRTPGVLSVSIIEHETSHI